MGFDTSTSFSGTRSLYVHTIPGGYAEIRYDATNYYQTRGQRILPNTSYVLTYRIKTELVGGDTTTANDGVYAQYLVSNSAGAAAGSYTNNVKLKETTAWTEYGVAFTTGPAAAWGHPEFRIYGHSGTIDTLEMKAWFDQWELRQVPSPARAVITGPFRQRVSNLIRNGDFEFTPTFTASTSANSVWITETAAGSAIDDRFGWGTLLKSGTVAVRFDPVGRNGGNAIRLSTLTSSSNVQVSTTISSAQVSVQRYGIPVLPNTQYRLSGWIKTTYVSGDALGAFLDFRERAITGGQVTTTTTVPIKTTQDWTYVEVVVTTNALTRYELPKLYIDGSTGGTNNLIIDAWFDDIELGPVVPISRVVA